MQSLPTSGDMTLEEYRLSLYPIPSAESVKKWRERKGDRRLRTIKRGRYPIVTAAERIRFDAACSK